MIKKNKALEQINAIRKHYGEYEFRMALQHFFDTGQLNFTEESVAEAKVEIHKETKKNAILTESLQCHLLDCCLELSRHHTWDILLYIKLYLKMEGDDLVAMEYADRALTTWNSRTAPEIWKNAVADPDYRSDIVREMVRQHNPEYSVSEIKEAISYVAERIKE